MPSPTREMLTGGIVIRANPEGSPTDRLRALGFWLHALSGRSRLFPEVLGAETPETRLKHPRARYLLCRGIRCRYPRCETVDARGSRSGTRCSCARQGWDSPEARRRVARWRS